MSPDPLDATAGVPYEHLATLRAECPVSKTASGAYYLARYEDVLAATKNLDAFQASFREAGVVVPPEEQLISEIPETRHATTKGRRPQCPRRSSADGSPGIRGSDTPRR